MNPELVPHTLVSMVALGMAVAFYSADRASATSRALALTLFFIGASVFSNVVVVQNLAALKPYAGWFAIPETIASIALLEWLLRVRRTVPARAGMNVATGDRALRVGQAVALIYPVLSILYPDQRSEYFLGALTSPDALRNPFFWLFAAPILFTMLAGLASILLLLNRKPDRAEKVRVLAMAGSVPFFVLSFVLPLTYSALAMALGEMILLVGATHYHVLQGQRGQFMSRFLSPQVAKLVSERGLRTAMQESNLEISVVCCDLRGFTPYAQANTSARVLQVLRQYYDAVGAIVAEYGATIKDFAGDGILILVGAPLPVPNHGHTALEMAQRIRDACRPLTSLWSSADHKLGIGVGVASGAVTVGIIGSATRLEYTAVGSAVNLASRLCEQAAHGEILVDERTVQIAGRSDWLLRNSVDIKGFKQPIPIYAVAV